MNACAIIFDMFFFRKMYVNRNFYSFKGPIWTYILGGGILALVAPYALSAWRSSAISFFEASSMTPMPSLSDENIFITAGQSIPWNMAATAGIGIANHAIIFASKGSITPRLG